MGKKLTAVIMTLLMVLTMAVLSVSPASAMTGKAAKAQAQAYNKHSIGLSSVENARELGGYKTKDGRTVKFGKLLRTGALTELSAADKKKLVNKYKVKKVIDFRSDGDLRLYGEDLRVPGAQYIRVPFSFDLIESYLRSTTGLELTKYQVEDLFSGKFDPDILSNYYESGYMSLYMTDKGKTFFRSFFDELLKANGGTVLFHCTAGKDRTGNAALLLLAVLGVDEKVILQDYMLTNEYIADELQAFADRVYDVIPNRQLAKDISTYRGVKKKWIMRSFDVIEARYGSAEAFFKKGLGYTNKDIQKLRSAYLQ